MGMKEGGVDGRGELLGLAEVAVDAAVAGGFAAGAPATAPPTIITTSPPARTPTAVVRLKLPNQDRCRNAAYRPVPIRYRPPKISTPPRPLVNPNRATRTKADNPTIWEVRHLRGPLRCCPTPPPPCPAPMPDMRPKVRGYEPAVCSFRLPSGMNE